jgi:hypothetical protein
MRNYLFGSEHARSLVLSPFLRTLSFESVCAIASKSPIGQFVARAIGGATNRTRRLVSLVNGRDSQSERVLGRSLWDDAIKIVFEGTFVLGVQLSRERLDGHDIIKASSGLVLGKDGFELSMHTSTCRRVVWNCV